MIRIEDIQLEQFYNINTFFLDDIEALESLAREIGFTCTFLDHQYQFQSIDEILEYKGSSIKKLYAVFSRSNSEEIISMIFDHKFVSILAKGKSIELKALWTELNSFLSKRKTRFFMLLTPYGIGGMSVGLGIGFSTLVFVNRTVQKFPVYEFAFLGILALVFIYSLYNWKTHPVIFLDRKHRRSTFWSRNSDNVIMLLIGALIGLFGKMLYDHFMK